LYLLGTWASVEASMGEQSLAGEELEGRVFSV